MNYFLAPRSGEKSWKNYKSTLRYGVPLDRIAPFLEPSEIQTLSQEETIYVWANRKGKQKEWSEMRTGDLVIFYAHRRLVMSGEVYLKKHSPDLALALWPRDEKGNPWEYVFFVRNLKYMSVPIEIFNEAAIYNKREKVVMGFTHLQQFRIDSIAEKYGSVESLLNLFADTNSQEKPTEKEKIYVNIPRNVEPLILNDSPLRPRNPREYAFKDKTRFLKIDYIARNQRNTLLGSKGEEVALWHEKDRLRKLGRADLAEKVTRVSLENDLPGYDILSFEEDGRKRFIEVKTSGSASKRIYFHVSSNEYEVGSREENYYIYYVEKPESATPRITPFRNPIDKSKFDIRPDGYIFDAERG